MAAQDASALEIDEEERLEAMHYRMWIRSRAEHIESVAFFRTKTYVTPSVS
jgi:hypothetical protein